MNSLKYYKGSFIFTMITIVLAYAYGMYMFQDNLKALGVVAIVAILSVLEVSLSFDNAVANAKVLKTMSDIWKHRFLTWGMVIAVFGMRIVFPVIIVSIVADINPLAALDLALYSPEQYAKTLTDSHSVIAGFGGAFLFLVAFEYFINHEKDVHWIKPIEKHLAKLGEKESVAIILALIVLAIFQSFVQHDQYAFFIAGIWGIVTHELVKLAGSFANSEDNTATTTVAKNGLASFMYLEVLDASFSFDGVIGAFVLSTNIFIIAAGLGIGAMFVRSMTIHLVEADTLSEFKYLEHGAFWSILILAGIMFASTLMHIPEVITGLLSVSLIGIAVFHSVVEKKRTR